MALEMAGSVETQFHHSDALSWLLLCSFLRHMRSVLTWTVCRLKTYLLLPVRYQELFAETTGKNWSLLLDETTEACRFL